MFLALNEKLSNLFSAKLSFGCFRLLRILTDVLNLLDFFTFVVMVTKGYSTVIGIMLGYDL